MPLAAAETVMQRAVKRAPATISKPSRGQPKKRGTFHIYTVSQLLESFRDPRAVLLEIAGTDTHILAEQIGCSMLEALAERRMAAQSVLPYVSQKLPVQVDMRHTRVINVNLLDKDEYSVVEAIALGEDEDTIEGQVVAVLPPPDGA